MIECLCDTSISSKHSKYPQRSLTAASEFYAVVCSPSDGWLDADNEKDGVCVLQALALEDRLAAAERFGESVACDVFVDGMDNAVELAYEARPEKICVVQDGVVVFLSGIGPYQYSPKRLQEWLNERFQ